MISKRSKSARRVVASLLVVAAAFSSIPLPAQAQDRTEALHREIRRDFMRICRDSFSAGNDGRCSVRFEEQALILQSETWQIRNVGNAEVDRRESEQVRIGLGDDAHFFCSSAGGDGRAPLFVACDFKQADHGPDCVERTWSETRASGENTTEMIAQPIAILAEPSARQCERLAYSLNSLLPGPRAGADPYARNPD